MTNPPNGAVMGQELLLMEDIYTLPPIIEILCGSIYVLTTGFSPSPGQAPSLPPQPEDGRQHWDPILHTRLSQG